METIGHLHVVRGRHHITDEERSTVASVYDEIVKMLTSWISYLDESDWKKRS